MADVPELDQFDIGIYQLETADPVLGGVGGIANAQAKGLANRTKFLKREVELRAPLISPALQGTPTAPTAAPGTNTTQVANAAFVQAALAALVNASPAALDTLNELAAALGNDANFAATMSNALGLKAPLASPAFTGNPTSATTPAQFDNGTSLATTAFVQRTIGSHNKFIGTTAGRDLLVSEIGSMIAMTGTIAHQVNLPAANSVGFGGRYSFMNVCTQTCNVQATSGNNITMGALPLGENGFIALRVGDSVSLVSDGGNWYADSGSATLKNTPGFGASLASSGYQKLPSGLIIQWGQWNQSDVANASTSFSIGYNIAFPNAALQGFLTVGNNINATAVHGSIEDLSSKTIFSGFTWSSNTIVRMYRWFVIGY